MMNLHCAALFSLLFMIYVVPSACQNQTNCIGSRFCGECLARDPACAWCMDEGNAGIVNARCDTETNLIHNGCANITNPHGSYKILKEDPLGDADDPPINKTVQVSPQVIKLTLRQGESQKITMYVRPAEDYPLDLYYLMDLSKSMEDDLVNIRNLGSVLARELQKLSSDVQMGFGSFVDKVVLPFVHTDPVKLFWGINPEGSNVKKVKRGKKQVHNGLLILSAKLQEFENEWKL